MDVVAAYGELLDAAPPTTSTVADIDSLPYPKETIKWALLTLLRIGEDSALRETLRIGYLRLADWQSFAVPPVRIDLARTRGNPLALAQQMAAESRGEETRLTAARTEQAALVQELQQSGLW
jgi:hypothetical protein